MLLTKDCKKVLNAINKLTIKGNGYTSFMDIIQQFPAKEQGKIALQLDNILIELKKLEYITYVGADDAIFRISPTYKGISYNEISWLEIKSFVIKSILIPILLTIVTAVITTKITLWLTPQQVSISEATTETQT